jgi:hypothetical protein
MFPRRSAHSMSSTCLGSAATFAVLLSSAASRRSRTASGRSPSSACARGSLRSWSGGRVRRHVGAAQELDQLRGSHTGLRAGLGGRRPSRRAAAPIARLWRPRPPPTSRRVGRGPGARRPGTLVGREALYWWPDDGWQRGRVARLCPRRPFSLVVAYRRSDSAPHRRHGRQCSASSIPPPAVPIANTKSIFKAICETSFSTPESAIFLVSILVSAAPPRFRLLRHPPGPPLPGRFGVLGGLAPPPPARLACGGMTFGLACGP